MKTISTRIFREGDYVKHFKRETINPVERPKAYLYRIICFAQETETRNEVVVYQSVETEDIWVRPLDMFLSEVDREKYPDINQEYRFEKMTPEEVLRGMLYGIYKG